MTGTKKLEIFCGTGGVGKTTLAASRAFHLAKENKILLITIDPSKRLKDVFKINDHMPGEISAFDDNLDILLMSPKATLKRMAKESDRVLEDNFIINTLSGPFGGMNEIFAIVEVYLQLKNDTYDTIVLDTPPGAHFIDFLSAGEKINNFFDNSFVEFFKFFKKGEKEKRKSLFGKVVKGGINKLLKYLEHFTGESFVNEFIDAIYTVFLSKKVFLDSLKFQDYLKDPKQSNWYLVTAVDHQKSSESLELFKSAKKIVSADFSILLNRSLKNELDNWKPAPTSNDLIFDIKKHFTDRENNLLNKIKANTDQVKIFPEIITSNVMEHVVQLGPYWK